MDPCQLYHDAAAATIAAVLAQIGNPNPASLSFEDGASGEIVAHIVLVRGEGEIECTLSSNGDLIAVRLIEA